MKRILPILFLFISICAFAQPQAINYQGVARDSLGHPLINQNIAIKLSILDSSNTGHAVYVETHSTFTNNTGLFNLGIGLGSVISGTFSEIPWSKGSKWLKVEMDANGGNNFQLIGTTQFLSVPYSIYSEKAGALDMNQSTPNNIKTLIYTTDGF